MSKDLIAEVAEACEARYMESSSVEDAVDAVLRERFYEPVPYGTTQALVERPVAPVPTVAGAARAALEYVDENYVPSGAALEVFEALRAALKAEEEAKR